MARVKDGRERTLRSQGADRSGRGIALPLALAIHVAWATLFLLAAMAGVACSSDAMPPASNLPSDSVPTATSDYSIKVWVERGGERKLVEFGPVDAVYHTADGSYPGSQPAGGVASPSNLRPMVNGTVENQDGGVIDGGDSTEGELAAGKQPGWGLLRAAVSQCIGETAEFGRATAEIPWSEGNWYFFPMLYGCDRTIQIQEVLLCAANKLAAVSSTVSMITWDDVYLQEAH